MSFTNTPYNTKIWNKACVYTCISKADTEIASGGIHLSSIESGGGLHSTLLKKHVKLTQSYS